VARDAGRKVLFAEPLGGRVTAHGASASRVLRRCAATRERAARDPDSLS
jgi:hypothetical protein